MMEGGCGAGGVHGCCAGWCCSSQLPGCPLDSAWYLVCELCRWTVVWADCRCFLSLVFLGGARRLGLSPCNSVLCARCIAVMKSHGAVESDSPVCAVLSRSEWDLEEFVVVQRAPSGIRPLARDIPYIQHTSTCTASRRGSGTQA